MNHRLSGNFDLENRNQSGYNSFFFFLGQILFVFIIPLILIQTKGEIETFNSKTFKKKIMEKTKNNL